MAYSFIDPPARPLFDPAVKRVWFAGMLLLAATLVLAAVLHLRSGDFEAALAKQRALKETLTLQNDQLAEELARYDAQTMRMQQASTENELFADQLFDLLDLVPDDATLTRFEMGEGYLLYSGECRNYPELKERLSHALSGQFQLQGETRESVDGKVRFSLRFERTGASR